MTITDTTTGDIKPNDEEPTMNYSALHETEEASETSASTPLVQATPADDNVNANEDESDNKKSTEIPNHVTVISPSDLPEGYQFTVVAENRALIVSVPAGGVKEGQQFIAVVAGEDITASAGMGENIPVGAWRDNLFDCCRLGICHPQMWLSWWCSPIALGQVLMRLNLDWFGNPVERPTACTAFKALAISYLVWTAIDNVLYYILAPYVVATYDADTGSYVTPKEETTWAYALDAVRQGISYAYAIYVFIVLVRARSFLRSKYSIPEQTCTGCEDICCSFWCHCCVISQMARHVNDYEHYDASCFSENGLADKTPIIV